MSTPTEEEEEEEHVSTEKQILTEEQQQVLTEEEEQEQASSFLKWMSILKWLEKCRDDRTSDLDCQINSCIFSLDLNPPEMGESEHQRAMFEYIKGRVYNVSPDYKQEAEYHLTQATKINTSFVEAWNSLGNCLAKKGDYRRAKNCFLFSISMGGGNLAVLRELAEIEVTCAPASEDPSEHINECVRYAQGALALNEKDVRSLYALGSAYFLSFHLTGGWDHDCLLRASEFFEKAVKIDAMKSHPKLHFNFAIVNRYLENYEMSLIGLLDSASTNPALGAPQQMQMMLQLLDKLERLLQGTSNDDSKGKSIGKGKGKNKGKSKRKRNETSMSSLIQSMATIDLNPSYNSTTMDLLIQGPNKGIAVIGRVRCLVKSEIQAPLFYVLCDSDQNSFVLTVFGIQKEAIKQGDQVTLLDPFCKFVDFEWQGKHYEFKSVRVNLGEQVVVNGNALPPNVEIRESIIGKI